MSPMRPTCSAASAGRSKPARRTADYQRFELEATYLTLTSNVVTAAVQEASLRDQIAATRDIIKSKPISLWSCSNQFDVGAAAKTDVLTQQSEVATAAGDAAAAAKAAGAAASRAAGADRPLSRARRCATRFTLASLRLPTDLPLSLPSQLVEQRPDVRAAEAQLHQASAQIGVAIANMLPQFNLTGDYGTAALTTATLFSPPPLVWSWRRTARSRSSTASRCCISSAPPKPPTTMAEAQYRNTVLAAFQNVADALRALATRCRDAAGAARRAARRLRDARSRARPISARRHHLCHPAQCAAQLSAGAARRGAGAGGALRRHRRAVPGARRRLVEPRRRRAQSAEPRGDAVDARPSRRQHDNAQ